MSCMAFFRLGQKKRRFDAGRAVGWTLVSVIIFIGSITAMHAQSPTEALFQAVEINDLTALEAAIDAGADLAAINEDGMTPADVAVDLGHFRAAHLLLARRIEGRNGRPRVTQKGREAVIAPRAQLQNPDIPATPVTPEPNPLLAEIVPPARPAPPSVTSQGPDTTETPIVESSPPPVMPTPRTVEELPATPASPPGSPADTPPEEEGLFTGLWEGVKDIVTLGGLIGGADAPATTTPPAEESSQQPALSSPADRFFSRPEDQSDGAAGRMVDRMRDMVGPDQTAENEFGLPELPVVPPLSPSDVSEVPELPPLIQPPQSAPTDLADVGVDVPGLVTPIDEGARQGSPADSLEIPGLPTGIDAPPSDLGVDVPGVVEGIETPASPNLDIPGLPPELGIPGLAAPADTPNLTDEVPGIIPPPSPNFADIPGLEALPGSVTGELRRPDGLIQPEDTSVLPPPGTSAALESRLRRIDDILNREPAAVRNRFTTRPNGDDTAVPPIRTAPPKPEVRTETVRGPTGQRETSTLGITAPRDPEAILRETRQNQTETRRVVQPVPPGPSPTPERLGHQLRPPAKGITTRDEPVTRLADRLANITERPYQDDDIHGLPIVRPSVDGTSPPRADIAVTELQENRQEQTDAQIHALARFFRGDQEEIAGMQPPERSIASEPLPRVIDNLIPENDPARGRVVDDRILDLSQVEPSQSDASLGTQADGRLNEQFLDRLTSVLGPTPRGPSAPSIGVQNGQTGIDLPALDIPEDQIVPKPRPDIPDPWTMTVERTDPSGDGRTLGVTSISPNDGSEIGRDDGTVQSMVGRIRQLLVGPEDTAARTDDLDTLDDLERQQTAEELLSEALRDGAPMALPDQSQWSVTEVDPASAPPGVPPRPRPGALTRTSLQDVVLSIGESVTLENTLPPQQDGLDPTNECIKKNRGTTLFCVESVDWPADLRQAFSVPTILYTGPMAITRYDQGLPSRFHALFDANEFEDVVAYFQARYGEPTEIWKRSIAPLAQPRMDNPTVTWRSRSSRDNVISVLEIRKFDDTRGGFPDTTRGAVMLYHHNAASIFPQVSSHELMRLRRTR